jgi:hypothetical protein
MQLDVRAAAVAGGLVWGILAMFVTGVVNLVSPGYGQGFLEVVASLYPGYTATPGFGQVVIGTLYGLLDGAVFGAVLAWMYNRAAAAHASRS